MTTPRYYSASWHRVAGFRPQLAEHATINRHRYRGSVWYVIDDRKSGRVHRFTPSAHLVISLMDGRRTVDVIWKEAQASLGATAPGQEEIIQLLGQLHANDLLRGNIVPDSAELFVRFEKQSKSRWLANLKNPLAIRLPLWDPNDFLNDSFAFVRPLFGWAGLAIWLFVVGLGVILAASHFSELTENISDRVLAGQNLFIIWLTFPLIKILHEMGHAYAAKAQGGEVHEMGVMLLALMAVPYVDASCSAGLRSKWKRALVGAAGIMVELFIAAIAMIFWLEAQPGEMRAFIFDVMLIASVSTLIFNGNPLLRYDGYYILCDLIEIPNLGTRANSYWKYLADRHIFGVAEPTPQDATTGERRWFLFYAPAALIYRYMVMFAIAVFLVNTFLIVGIVMALWSALTLLLFPLVKGIAYVLSSPQLRPHRRRAVGITLAAVVGLALFLTLAPMPMRVQSEGVLWLPEQAEVRAGGSGFVSKILVNSGQNVEVGDALMECEDPVLAAEIRLYRAKVEEIETRRSAEWVQNRNQAEITREELAREKANLARALERAEKLTLRSRASGVFVLAKEDDLPGKFIQQGELVGYVVSGSAEIVRVVVDQGDIDMVRRKTLGVEVRFASQLDHIVTASLIREVPMAKSQLPSLALSTEGGGQTPLDPRDPEKSKALASLFQFDLALDSPQGASSGPLTPYGSRVHVRFELEPEPLARQFWRRTRQIFLRRMNV